MSDPNNVRLVQEAYAAFKRGDINSVLNSVAADADWHLPGPPDIVPVVGRRKGRDQIAGFFAKLAELQEPQLFEPRQFISDGDKVVVLGEYHWRVKSTGRSFHSDWAHVFTVKDGKVTGFQEYFDTDAAVNAYKA
jgi:ketosteroid isomerase-like protein